MFCQLAAALLHAAGSGPAADALLLQQLVQLRPLVGGLLQHLGADPPAHQLQVRRGKWLVWAGKGTSKHASLNACALAAVCCCVAAALLPQQALAGFLHCSNVCWHLC